LTRNVLASVNGLYDGWRYSGFHAHRIHGPPPVFYPEEDDSSDHWWWKFDLPPGWEDTIHRPLVDICAFQWLSAARGVQEALRRTPALRRTMFRLPFEKVVGSVTDRMQAVDMLSQWLDIGLDPALREAFRRSLPPIMSTARPRRRRWFKRAALLSPLLERDEIRDMMACLGYGDEPALWE